MDANRFPQHPPDPVAYAPNVEFRVLGPVEVLEADRRMSVGGPKQRTVLALIVANAGQVISTDRLEASYSRSRPRIRHPTTRPCKSLRMQ